MAALHTSCRRSGASRSSRARFAAALLACGLAGCAPTALLPYASEQPPTVTLPLAHAGIVDARAPFATLFAEELGGDADVGAWLHGVTARAPTSSPPPELASRFAARAASTSVLVVTGLFGDCLGAQAVPFGDGVPRAPGSSLDEGYRQYDDLGLLAMHFVVVAGRASSAANGQRIAEAIRAEAARPGVERIVLVGYSKGVPDLQHALETMQRDGGVPRQVAALVSVAGAVMGTPLADFYESAYDSVSPLVTPFECTPAQGGELASLTRRERVAWLATHRPPAGIATFSIVAHAPLDEIAPALRVPARQLAAVDPRNDGQLIASDAMLPGSTLLAEVRADHWDAALPRERHPDAMMRALTSGRGFPREALWRATLKWVVGTSP